MKTRRFILFMLVCWLAALQSPAQTFVSVYKDAEGTTATVTLSPSALYVKIGGVTQWFTISGINETGYYLSNPVSTVFMSADTKRFVLFSEGKRHEFELATTTLEGGNIYQSAPASPSRNPSAGRQCGYCNGTGACPYCNSAGQSNACVNNRYGAKCTDPYCIRTNHRCKNCNGTHRCSNCNGTGYVTR